MLFVQADRGLRSILFSVKEPKKLPVIFPIPAGVAYMHKAFILDLVRDVAQRWESVRGGRTFRSKLLFFWKPERTNSGENFQPREKQPAHCGDQTPDPATGNKINREKSGRENAKRTGFLCIRVLKTAQADAKHGHAECKKDAEKHYGLISCSFRNFSS